MPKKNDSSRTSRPLKMVLTSRAETTVISLHNATSQKLEDLKYCIAVTCFRGVTWQHSEYVYHKTNCESGLLHCLQSAVQ
jgi:hypothetical protein